MNNSSNYESLYKNDIDCKLVAKEYKLSQFKLQNACKRGTMPYKVDMFKFYKKIVTLKALEDSFY